MNKKKNISITNRFYNFFKLESFSGILLICITFFALILANSPFYHFYHEFVHLKIGLCVEHFCMKHSLAHWVNDALMAIFFVVVGLEIKREILIGELSDFKKALLPMLAAMGGMFFPALIFYFINYGTPGVKGWGIPMATDIAFALGILILAGRKFPISLKVFLTALAIIDDIGGVLVIAIFYTKHINFTFLLLAIVIFLVMLILNKSKIQNPIPYSILGMIMWFFMYYSGIHATLSGLLSAIAIPARGVIDIDRFLISMEILLNKIASKVRVPDFNKLNPLIIGKKTSTEIHTIEEITHNFIPPLLKIEHTLHPWVSFAILPLFAFVNAGVHIEGDISQFIFNKITIGIFLGLVLGKVMGIFLFSFLGVKLKICNLPKGVTWKMIFSVGILGGIGFTMSFFISSLAFTNPDYINASKIGILLASFVSSILGIIMLKFSKEKETVKEKIKKDIKQLKLKERKF